MFAVAVHQLADYEHNHELPFDYGEDDCPTSSAAFMTFFLHRPMSYPRGSVVIPWPNWVFQATEYINTSFQRPAEVHAEETVMMDLCFEHIQALEALVAS